MNPPSFEAPSKKLDFYGELTPRPNPKAGGPTPIGCPRLLVQYIRSYPQYPEALSSIRNLRTHYGMVTGTYLTWTA